jgi:hypothetical protein
MVSTTTARKPKPRSSCTGNRAPRAAAASPASTPAQPRPIAIHSMTTVVAPDRCHQDGLSAPGTTGTETFGPLAAITTMTRTDRAIAAAPSQAVSRTGADPACGTDPACGSGSVGSCPVVSSVLLTDPPVSVTA